MSDRPMRHNCGGGHFGDIKIIRRPILEYDQKARVMKTGTRIVCFCGFCGKSIDPKIRRRYDATKNRGRKGADKKARRRSR